jgi:hypothetical protein
MSNTAHHKRQLSPLERRSFEMMTIAELERKQMKRVASSVKHAARRRILADRFVQSLQKAGVEFPRAQIRSELERRPDTRPAPTFSQPVPTFDPKDSNVRFPPYDNAFTSGTGADAAAAANKDDGTASIFAEGNDGLRFVSAYLGIWVQAAQDNRFARFAALIDYSYSWLASAVNAYAHSNAGPLFNVFGYTEQTQVGLNYVDPQWDVQLSGFPGDTQSNSDEGRISDEVIFPVSAGSWYLVWVQLECLVQDDGHGLFYDSDANAIYDIRVPLTVFQNVAT